MVNNLNIDLDLLKAARRIGGHRSDRATVLEALHEYIQRRRQAKIIELFGKIEYAEGYDYKKQRRKI